MAKIQTGPKRQSLEAGIPPDCAGESPACNDTLCRAAREIFELLGTANINLGCVLDRMRTPPASACGAEAGGRIQSLMDLLTDCKYVARLIVNQSQELSGIVGE